MKVIIPQWLSNELNIKNEEKIYVTQNNEKETIINRETTVHPIHFITTIKIQRKPTAKITTTFYDQHYLYLPHDFKINKNFIIKCNNEEGTLYLHTQNITDTMQK